MLEKLYSSLGKEEAFGREEVFINAICNFFSTFEKVALQRENKVILG